MNRNIVKATALSVAAVPAAAAGAADRTPAQEPEQRPNIVVIIADDLLSSELGCYGGQNIDTPNIDRLAREGVQFYHNYASEAMSVPIRASMYTGLYPAHHGSYQNHKNTFPGTKTVNEYMPEVGYRVGRTGKDHPGPKSVYKFDEIPGFTVGCTAKKAPYSTDGIREWMSRSDDPFLLFVCSINTHAPWTWGDPGEFDPDKIKVPGNCVDSPEMREIMTRYLAELRALDNEVGSVLQTLEDIGKLDNTIVFFLGVEDYLAVFTDDGHAQAFHGMFLDIACQGSLIPFAQHAERTCHGDIVALQALGDGIHLVLPFPLMLEGDKSHGEQQEDARHAQEKFFPRGDFLHLN